MGYAKYKWITATIVLSELDQFLNNVEEGGSEIFSILLPEEGTAMVIYRRDNKAPLSR